MATGKTRSRLFSLLALSAVWLALGVAFAAPAGAGEANGCTWSVKSLDRDGKVIDTASGPGSGATKDNPLLIDQQGKIEYQATTDQVIAHGSWNVETSGAVSISFGGDVKNDSGTTDKSGTEELESRLTVDMGPFGRVALFTGLIHVDFKATGANGATCTASGWLETNSNTFGSVPFVLGALAALGGISLLFFGWPVSTAGPTGATGPTPSAGSGGGGAAGAAGGAPAEGPGPRPGPIGGAP